MLKAKLQRTLEIMERMGFYPVVKEMPSWMDAKYKMIVSYRDPDHEKITQVHVYDTIAEKVISTY